MGDIGSQMPLLVFLVIGTIAVASSILVVAMRNPVHSALFLLLTFLCVAVLFVIKSAEFVAAVQVLVYAGGIMVLFLFVVMLLDLKEEERRKIRKFSLVAGVVSVGAIVGIIVKSLLAAKPGAGLPAPQLEGATAPLGRLLFTHYLLPFEIVSVLLLVAMVGVILLSKKDLK